MQTIGSFNWEPDEFDYDEYYKGEAKMSTKTYINAICCNCNKEYSVLKVFSIMSHIKHYFCTVGCWLDFDGKHTHEACDLGGLCE